MPKAEEQKLQENAQFEEERKEEQQDRPVVYLSQAPVKEKEAKEHQNEREHKSREANVGENEQEHQERDIPKILDENIKLIDGDGREYMQPKGHEHWNNGKTLFIYHQTEAQKEKPIPDATDLHAFVITLDRRSDSDFLSRRRYGQNDVGAHARAIERDSIDSRRRNPQAWIRRYSRKIVYKKRNTRSVSRVCFGAFTKTTRYTLIYLPNVALLPFPVDWRGGIA